MEDFELIGDVCVFAHAPSRRVCLHIDQAPVPQERPYRENKSMTRIVSLVFIFFCVWISAAHSQEPAAPAAAQAEQSVLDKAAGSVGPIARAASPESLPEWWLASGWWLVAAVLLLALIVGMLAIYIARLA